MKRLFIKAQLVLFGHCYCASPRAEVGRGLDDLVGLRLPVPVKAWAERAARRNERATGMRWTVIKWGRTYPVRLPDSLATQPRGRALG